MDLRVRNRDSRAHAYEVTATDYDGRAKSGRLAAGESTTASDFLPYQDYAHSDTVAVAVDGTRVREVDVFVQFDVNEMDVDVLDAETVEIGPDDVFSPTPPEQ